jgi:DNA mismatch repair ATPase MutL
VHPTKQLVRFSDEKEVRLAISEAIRTAIQGTGDPGPEQDGHSTPSGTYLGASSHSASENAADAPVAAPKHHPTDDHPAGGATSLISPARRLGTNNEGGSGLPDSLFEASKDSRSDPLWPADLSEQRERLQQASAPLSRVGPAAGVERGELP